MIKSTKRIQYIEVSTVVGFKCSLATFRSNYEDEIEYEYDF